MKADELRELAERVSRAEAPTVDLYREVYVAVNGPKPERVHGGSSELTQYLYRYNPFYSLATHGGWLDAAAKLVPGGWDWMTGTNGTGGGYAHCISDEDGIIEEQAATPALALIAASLRARASLLDTQTETM